MRRFGKYEVLRRLAAGGMGEIFLARQSGVAGFERPVIIKTLHPELASQESFITLFLDEARVVARLNHPGIVAIYDIDSHEGTYFLALEFIHGVNLSQLRGACAKRGVQVPLPVAACIARDAAVALDHAHHARTPDGQPAEIIHRDISPQNIMVRDDGITKVVDFGIARAAQRQTRTETGQIKGKFAYMAPEQIEGQPLDGRVDQFSLGVVLWELCAGQPLFEGDNPLDVFKQISDGARRALREVRADVPEAFEQILDRMLAGAPADRFERCQQVADALDRFLADQPEPAGQQQVARFVQEVAAEHLETLDIDITAAEPDPRPGADSGAPTAKMRRPASDQGAAPRAPVELFPSEQAPRWRPALLLALLGVVTLAAVISFLLLQPLSGLGLGASAEDASLDAADASATRQAVELRLALFPFAVLNRDPGVAYMGPAATERVSEHLDVGWLELVGAYERQGQPAPQGPSELRGVDAEAALQLASEADAQFAVLGTVERQGDDVVLRARLLSVATGQEVEAAEERGDSGKLFGHADELARRLLSALKVQRAALESAAHAAVERDG